MNTLVKFDADNLIYNRFDLIYPKDTYSVLQVARGEDVYQLQIFVENETAYLDNWGKVFPEDVFSDFVNQIFEKYPSVEKISLKRSGNSGLGFVYETNDIVIDLPETEEELLQRMSSKGRYNLKREFRCLEESAGKILIESYDENVPEYIVEEYFKYKRESMGSEYGLTPEEYLNKYHVTNAMAFKSKEYIAILFYCKVDKICYLENFSFSKKYDKYSPGFQIYVEFLKEAINKAVRRVYLGGGTYSYKKRLGAYENTVFGGEIYSERKIRNIKEFFENNGIEKVAIYGYGKYGDAFIKLSKQLGINVIYAIDRNEIDKELPTYSLNDDNRPKVDSVVVTIKDSADDIKEELSQTQEKCFTLNEILSHNC